MLCTPLRHRLVCSASESLFLPDLSLQAWMCSAVESLVLPDPSQPAFAHSCQDCNSQNVSDAVATQDLDDDWTEGVTAAARAAREELMLTGIRPGGTAAVDAARATAMRQLRLLVRVTAAHREVRDAC